MSSPDSAPVVLTPVLEPADDALAALTRRSSGISSSDRDLVVACIEDILDCMRRAKSLWQDYADTPTESDVAYTPVMKIGAGRARSLHQIHLELRELARALTASSGVAFRDTIGISAQIDIVEAYEELGENETGAERAAKALSTLQQRIDGLEGVSKQL